MNDYTFRDSATEKVSKTVLIALAGTTGSGKTESAMRLASGIVKRNGGKFCVIDTENRRALNKKKRYNFDHLDLKPPYSPANYQGAIDAAIKAGYKAIVVDSASHEWMGEGGCSDMQEQVLERMCKGDMGKAERMTALAWKEPKQAHKKLMYQILKSDVPIIFCLRAEPKIKFQKDSNGKTQVVDAGWQPICEKMFGYEMLVYALLMPDNPGVPVHLKQLEPDFEGMFPVGKQITEKSGELIAGWASDEEPAKIISTQEQKDLWKAAQTMGITQEVFQSQYGSLRTLTVDQLPEVKQWISSYGNVEPENQGDGFFCELCQQVNSHAPQCPERVPGEGE